MTSHLYEPPPGAGARQQELAYAHLRAHVQKQCELLVQYEGATFSGKAKAEIHLTEQDATANSGVDDWSPDQNDPAEMALYAVYAKGWQKGRGKGGKGKGSF